MNYSIIKISGKQYKVTEGDEILVELLGDKKPEAEVLMSVTDKAVKVGTPTVKGAKIDLKIVSDIEKGEKIRVFKYKSKSRYRKTKGHRSKYTRLKVNKLGQ